MGSSNTSKVFQTWNIKIAGSFDKGLLGFNIEAAGGFNFQILQYKQKIIIKTSFPGRGSPYQKGGFYFQILQYKHQKIIIKTSFPGRGSPYQKWRQLDMFSWVFYSVSTQSQKWRYQLKAQEHFFTAFIMNKRFSIEMIRDGTNWLLEKQWLIIFMRKRHVTVCEYKMSILNDKKNLLRHLHWLKHHWYWKSD